MYSKTIKLLIAMLCFYGGIALGQPILATHYSTPQVGFEPTSEEELRKLSKQLHLTSANLIKQGKWQLNRRHRVSNFISPLQASPDMPYNNPFFSAEHVNLGGDDALLDYNCGDKTFNGSVSTWYLVGPAWWEIYEENWVEVVAVAEGIIVDKVGGNFSAVCEIADTTANNYVILQHADGRFTYYFSLKDGSMTDKGIGDIVAQGEVLGTVGSSGNWNRPHLEFIYASEDNFALDPFAGDCSSRLASSSFVEQEPYVNSRLQLVTTTRESPDLYACPEDESLEPVDTFRSGDTLQYLAYYMENQLNDTFFFSTIDRDGDTVQVWIDTLIGSESYFGWRTWFDVIQDNTEPGDFTLQVKYKNDTLRKDYVIINECFETSGTPTSLIDVLCPGDAISWGEIVIDTPGIYRQTFSALNGCDSTVIINYSAAPDEPLVLFDTMMLCPGDSVTINNQTYFDSNIVVDSIFATSGTCLLSVENTVIKPYQLDTVLIERINDSTVSLVGDNITSVIWINCTTDEVVAEGNLEFQPREFGEYAARTLQHGCFSTTSCYMFDAVVRSKNYTVLEGVRVFPNPVEEEIMVENNSSFSSINYELYNAFGERIHLGTIQSVRTNLTVDLRPGIYYLLVHQGERRKVLSILKP